MSRCGAKSSGATLAHDAGAMVFHGEYAQACLDELAKWVPPAPASCSGTHVSDHLLTGHERPAFAQISACRLTEQGQLMNGAGCEYDSQCSDGLRCRSYAGSSTDFRCQPLRKLHEPCGLQSDCDTSLACIGDTGLAACDTLHDTGESCIFTSDCKDGLLCANKTCITPPTSGAACGSQDGYSCAPLLGCSLNSQRCVSLGSTGASCSASTQCEGRGDSTTMKCVSICGGTW